MKVRLLINRGGDVAGGIGGIGSFVGVEIAPRLRGSTDRRKQYADPVVEPYLPGFPSPQKEGEPRTAGQGSSAPPADGNSTGP